MARLPVPALLACLLAAPALAAGRAPPPPAACAAPVQRTAYLPGAAPVACCGPGSTCPRFLSTRSLVRPEATHAL